MLRSQQVEATRRAVLAAARSSFGRKGYVQTSVDEIAAAAGVTKGAVYHHFAGKEARGARRGVTCPHPLPASGRGGKHAVDRSRRIPGETQDPVRDGRPPLLAD